ncbi:MAG: hypothetical protein JNK04_07600 [Myxococcales bacterium]|nr:hypothetical protein [Myxococcales bacterium]
MPQPIAKQGDLVVGVDTHIVMIPSPGGPVPTPLPSPFNGQLDGNLSDSVFIDDKAVALVDSEASNMPKHIPAGGPFQTPPTDKGVVKTGSSTVFINDRAVARAGDTANTCNDPADAPNGVVIAVGVVMTD